MTIAGDPSPTTRVAERRPYRPMAPATQVTVYADLGAELCHLAHQRAERLQSLGIGVDWRMVDPRRLAVDSPAVSGYAEAVLAGVGPAALRLLHEARWTHRVDVDDPRLVRTLLADVLRSGSSPSELVSTWGYGVDVTGAPVTTAAWRLVRDWREEWSDLGADETPVVLPQQGAALRGAAAVEWLGAQIARQDRAPAVHETAPQPTTAPTDLVDLQWATAHGGRWLERRRDALAAPLMSRLRRWV